MQIQIYDQHNELNLPLQCKYVINTVELCELKYMINHLLQCKFKCMINTMTLCTRSMWAQNQVYNSFK